MTSKIPITVHAHKHWVIPAPELPTKNKSSKTCPNRKMDSVDHDSIPKPACMARKDIDATVSDFLVTSLTARLSVRAKVVQASMVFFDTLATIEKLIVGAAAYGSQLVVFPEAFLGGYPRCVRFDATNLIEEDDGMQRYYASTIDVPGPEVGRLVKIAGKYKVHLVMGVVERAGFYLYNTMFFDSQGQHLGQHRKITLVASESAVWYSGGKSTLPIYETSIRKIDGLTGVEIFCAPTADAGEIWKASMTHIALEGGCFVLFANQFCRRKDYPFPPRDSNGVAALDAITCVGGNVIISPSGTILVGPNYHGECLTSTDLDLGDIILAKTQASRLAYHSSKFTVV